MTFWRVMIAMAGLALAASIVWASFAGAIFEEGGAILAMPWGVVTFIDLYAGFFIGAVAIAWLEPKRWLGIALALSVFVLGNVVTAAWVVWRAPMIASRLRAVQPKA